MPTGATRMKIDFSGDKERLYMASKGGQRALRNLRTYQNRKNNRLRRNTLYTPLGRSFPSIMNMKFTYNSTKVLTSNGTGLNFYQYRLNSIYDPDYSSGLGQLKATPWNEMANIYQEYEVYGAMVTIRFQPINNQVTGHVVIKAGNYGLGVAPSVDNALANGPGYRSYVTSNYTEAYVYKKYFNIEELSGIPRDDQDLQSVFAGNPSASCVLQIIQWTSFENGVTFEYDVAIKYYAKLMKPNVIFAQS